jgi:TPR repeat protein
MNGISFHDSKNMQLTFANVEGEKAWLRSEADRGDVQAQHRLGLLLMEKPADVSGIREAYKWLFISASLGHLTASKVLLDVMLLMGDDESDDAYELVLEWYDDKFDDSRGEDQQDWSLELLRMRFGATLLN